MIYYPNKVPLTDRLREVVSGNEPDFPYVAMEADLDLYAGRCTPWHWHDFFEIATVKKGDVEIITQQGAFVLREGEGYFLNANVLHKCGAMSGCDGVMQTQLFSRELLTGCGLLGRKYVSPLENCVGMEFQPLYPENEAHRPLLEAMEEAFAAAEEDDAGHEMRINGCLLRLWEKIYRLAEPMLKAENPPAREDSLRVKKMLEYIHEHYGEEIAVRNIAAAAGICERECYRCFEKVLDTTPQNYLARHRINAAARMLTETEASVGQIAQDCGFSSAGYFGKVFRGIMGCSPREFRKDK